MKKIFTLLLGLFLACSVNAAEPIDFTKIAGFAYNEPFTLGAWDWKGVTLAEGDLDVDSDNKTADDSGVSYYDGSDYDYVVVKYSSASADVLLHVQYKCKGTVGEYGAEYNQDSGTIYFSADGGYAALALDANQKNAISQVAIQGGEKGATITIEEVYFATAAEWEAVKTVNPTKDVLLSGFSNGTQNDDGTVTFTGSSGYGWFGSWLGSFDASDFDYFVLELAEQSNIGVQVLVQYNVGSDDAGNITAGELLLKVALNPDNKNSIKQIGLQNIQPGSFTVKAAYFATQDYVENMEVVLPDKMPLPLDNLNSGQNGTYNADTKTITISEESDGSKGWWFNSPIDYSYLNNVVIQFEATNTGGTVIVEYNAEGVGSDAVTFYPGATCVVVPLNNDYSDAVRQIFVQGSAGSTYTLVDAFVAIESLTPEAYLGTPPVTVVLNEEESFPVLTEGDIVNIEMVRNFNLGWNSFCIPTYMTPPMIKQVFGENVKVFMFSDFTDGKLNFATSDLETDETTWVIDGYNPYLIYISDSDAPALTGTFTLNDAKVRGNVDAGNVVPGATWDPNETGVVFQGTYTTISGSDLWGLYGVTAEGYIQVAGQSATMKGYRAYFNGIPEEAAAKGITMVFDGVTTGISEVTTFNEVFGNSAVYNLNGQRVTNSAAPGIYIRNGKKYIQK